MRIEIVDETFSAKSVSRLKQGMHMGPNDFSFIARMSP